MVFPVCIDTFDSPTSQVHIHYVCQQGCSDGPEDEVTHWGDLSGHFCNIRLILLNILYILIF